VQYLLVTSVSAVSYRVFESSREENAPKERIELLHRKQKGETL
jgi:hypothetical protein